MIDAHVHVASADEQRYPRSPTGAGGDWWRSGGDAADLAAALDGAGVDRAVIVQAIGVYAYDCRYAVDAVTVSGGRFALVGAVDMDGADPAAALAKLAAGTPLAGVRTFAVGAAGTAWLTNGAGDAVWELAGELGLVVVPTIFTDQLPALRTLLERHPQVDVALDHCAFPDMAPAEQRGDLLQLAELPALHLKVTSHNLDGAADPAAFLEPLVTAFGADRLAWGSDHPQHSSLRYPEMVALAQRAARHLGPPEQAAFFGATSQRLWFRDLTAASQPGPATLTPVPDLSPDLSPDPDTPTRSHAR